MSYRLITKATFVVINATGVKSEREVDVRAYPSPKRDASGPITVDGAATTFKRTGGKGRGTADRRYAYFPMSAESAYIEITEAEAAAMVGGTVAITAIAAKVAPPAPQADGHTDAAKHEDAAATGTPQDAPAPALTKAQRRAARATA